MVFEFDGEGLRVGDGSGVIEAEGVGVGLLGDGVDLGVGGVVEVWGETFYDVERARGGPDGGGWGSATVSLSPDEGCGEVCGLGGCGRGVVVGSGVDGGVGGVGGDV